jgi:hypothetical protein
MCRLHVVWCFSSTLDSIKHRWSEKFDVFDHSIVQNYSCDVDRDFVSLGTDLHA